MAQGERFRSFQGFKVESNRERRGKTRMAETSASQFSQKTPSAQEREDETSNKAPGNVILTLEIDMLGSGSK
ncbi:MAG: hypothetical protein ABSD13_09395 [Candidatus Korobacteraceae bacterium]